jgi:hypothetical protein
MAHDKGRTNEGLSDPLASTANLWLIQQRLASLLNAKESKDHRTVVLATSTCPIICIYGFAVIMGWIVCNAKLAMTQLNTLAKQQGSA